MHRHRAANSLLLITRTWSAGTDAAIEGLGALFEVLSCLLPAVELELRNLRLREQNTSSRASTPPEAHRRAAPTLLSPCDRPFACCCDTRRQGPLQDPPEHHCLRKSETMVSCDVLGAGLLHGLSPVCMACSRPRPRRSENLLVEGCGDALTMSGSQGSRQARLPEPFPTFQRPSPVRWNLPSGGASTLRLYPVLTPPTRTRTGA